MIIWGKVVGALIGFIFYGPVGIILGLVFGQIFDNGLRGILNAPAHTTEVRAVFFKTVFQTMGYVAKADGRVSEKEIQVARSIMINYFKLNQQQMHLAIDYFNEGKQPGFNLEAVLQKFRTVCGKYIELRRIFLEIIVKAAMADQILRDAQRGRLVFICSCLGIQLLELEFQLRSYGYSNYSQQQDKSYEVPAKQPEDKLSAAYKVLGVNANDSIKTIKSAYRRKVSKYHPDKLVARGLPPEMMEIAKERTQQITVAYDTIMRSRG